MADRPAPPSVPAGPRSARTGARIDAGTGRPGIANADVPSETVGLPGVGEGASAAHFARDSAEWQNAEPAPEPDAEPAVRAPADPRDQPRHGSG